MEVLILNSELDKRLINIKQELHKSEESFIIIQVDLLQL